MSLQFIYGKSGTGKTSYCFRSIANLIKNNQKVYMITPEQFSFTAEKNLMEVTGKEAVMNAEVITFKRMAYRILKEVGGYINHSISECGKAMLLASILEKQKNSLNVLGKTDKNLDVVLRMMTEFKKNKITAQLLEEKIDTLTDPYLQIKLKDAQLVYQEFNHAIQHKYLDEEDVLTMIKEKIPLCSFLKDTYLYIDEFSGFTKQEYGIIEELLKTAKKVHITMCTDSLEKNKIPENDIFAPNKNTILKVMEIASKNGIKIEEPVFLGKAFRYQTPELRFLTDNYTSFLFTTYPEKVNHIRLSLAKDPYSEIEKVANQIIELVREKGYAFHEISVITQEIEDYASWIRSIFRRYGIPVFIDEKKDFYQNSFVQYMLSIVNVLSKGFRLEEVMNYLKSGFLEDITDQEMYVFENYCRKYGVTGRKKFETAFTIRENEKEDLETLNHIRTKVIEPLICLKDEIGSNKTVKEITKLVYQLMERKHIQQIAFSKIEKWKTEGKIELANSLLTSWQVFVAVLDEFVLVLQEEQVSFEHYVYLLKTGFQHSSFGKIPATIDEVIVGDVDRTRSAKKRAIFIIGLNDGKFPSLSKNEGYISDEERTYLKEKKIELAKTTKEQLWDENFNIYKAFGVAEELLYLSYVASDKEGKTLRQSIFVNQIKKMFPLLQEESDLIQTHNYIASKEITFEFLLENIRKYCNGESIDPIWFAVYQIYQEDSQYQHQLEKAMQGLYYHNSAETIQPENMEKWYGSVLQTSISKLENYRKCPYSYFLKYGLKLEERTELKLEKLDTGTLMHTIIDSFFVAIQENNCSLQEITEEEIEKIIEEIIQYQLQLKQNYMFSSTSKYKVLTKRLIKVMKRAMMYIVHTLKNSNFRVLGTEMAFGDHQTYPPISIQLEKGKTVELIGKIDRVDVAENKNGKYIRIIDYKSSVKSIDLNEVVAGIQIQLLTYLDAVTKNEEADVAGMLYFNLIEPVIKAKNKHLTEEEIEQEIRNHFKMNGFILADVEVVKMMDSHLEVGSSSMVPAYLDKEGNLSTAKSSTLKKEEFAQLQNKVEKIIKEIAEEMLSGNIEQKPTYSLKNKKAVCQYCSYKTICGFNPKMGNNQYRFIPNLSKNEILDQLQEEKESQDDEIHKKGLV